MKNMVLLVTMLFITLISFTQEKWYVDTNWRNVFSKNTKTNKNTNNEVVSVVNKKWMNNSAGDELKKYSRHFYFGTGLMLAGSGVGYLGYNNGNRNILRIGVGLVVLGGLITLESHIHIKRAGFILNQNGLGVKIGL